MIKNSFIYTGNVVHKRFKPKIHFFKYKVFSLLLDLSEIHLLDKNLKIFSYNKFNIVSFYDKDHGARDGSSIQNWVIDNLKKNNIDTNNIQIKLLCYPRIFGYVFNPLSIFYVYDKNFNLISILYEVKNTFGEQHTYVFRCKDFSNLILHNCKKKFYVSPFIEMKTFYNFRLLRPGKKINILIKQKDENGLLLIAHQTGKRVDLTSKNLFFEFIKHPLMSVKVISAIHFEAFRLWVKGIKHVKKKIKIRNNVSFEKL